VNATTLPPTDYADILRNVVMPIAPAGMRQVFLNDGSTTVANENALSVSLIKYGKDHGIDDLSQLTVLGFKTSHHGNSISTLSCSDPSINVRGVPTHDWPIADFPKLQYPIAKFEHENRSEEDRCLEKVRQMIVKQREMKKEIGAMIIEPIGSYNNSFATPYFFKRVRAIAKENGIPFIVDETKTGVGSTGKLWGHEHWYM
jgi:4-aminobutyrate aminotransferase/(S)-3-amino-2-methylpropionate transaminase